MFLGVLDTNVNGDIHCLALRIIHWQNHVRPRDIVERLRDTKYDCAEEAAEEIEKLRAATGSLVRSLSGTWSAFEPSLRREMGNTNYHCVKEKMDKVEALLDLRAAAAALKETGDE